MAAFIPEQLVSGRRSAATSFSGNNYPKLLSESVEQPESVRCPLGQREGVEHLCSALLRSDPSPELLSLQCLSAVQELQGYPFRMRQKSFYPSFNHF